MSAALQPEQPQADLAPGSLDLVRQFENTVDLPDGPDRLDSVEQASAWCRAHGLAPVKNEGHFRLLRAFREALRDVLYANNGEGDSEAAWAGLRPFMASAHLSLEVNPDQGLELRPVSPEDAGPIASLLAIVYEAQVRGTWPRLRACRKASCRFAYFDQTKNASRAWCSMATCGNQAKAQRRRERERKLSS
jgi:predicted RNA-binding Zn ribbon-like protein